MGRPMRLSLSLSMALLVFAVSPGPAQDFRATLTGRVADPSNAAIPGVSVQIKNVGTNEATTVIADDQGNYRVPLLKPGTYLVTAELAGFKKYVRDGVELSVGQVATLNIVMEIGQITEQVTVTANAEILETSTANRGSVIDNQQVREFPLNARNPFMLGMLVAGVNFNGASIWQRPFDNGAIAEWTINGSQSRGNEFLLDGAPNNGQAGGNNIALVPPVDSVEEFKIQTNTYDAQYGKTTGGIINVSLRSGTNSFHGSLYEFARRDAWDANDFRLKAKNQPRAEHFLDQYGFQFQGPVILPKLYNGKDKTFWMFNYEGYREGVPAPLTLSVPEPEMLLGDFSKLVDAQGKPIIIYDPLTGKADSSAPGGWVRDPFPDNKIPASRINPIASKILSYQPKPNTKSTNSGYAQSNLFIGDNIAGDDFYNWVLKVDQNIGAKHRMFARYAANDRTEDRADGGVVKGPGMTGQQPFKRINHAAVLDHVGTMSATFMFNVRASFNRFEENGYGRDNLGFDKTTLGFPKSLVDQIPHGANFGRYEFAGYNSLGRYQSRNITNTWAVHPSFNKIRGSHTLRAGVDMRWTQYITQNQGNPFRLRAERGFTQRVWNQADANSGDSIASFLIGLPSAGSTPSQVEIALYPTTLWNYYAPWFQDDWKVNRRLTLNLGLRWDLNYAPNERYNRINRGFDATAMNPVDKLIDRTKFPDTPKLMGGLLFAGVGGQDRTVSELDKNNIQPRIGAAYQLNKKLVVRGGWGLYYVNPNNDYLIYNGFSQTTTLVDSLDGGRTPRDPNMLGNLFPNEIQVPSGSSLGLETFLGRGYNIFNPGFSVPYVHQFSLGFQYELGWGSKVEVAYVGNRTMKLQTERDFNEPSLALRQKCNPLEGGLASYCDERLPNPFRNIEQFRGTTLFSAATVSRWSLSRPYPQFAGILERGLNAGRIWYNSAQVTFEKRAKSSLNMIATYTLSKQIEQWGFQDTQKNIVQRGLYVWDRPHRFTVGSVYQLPIGPGRHFLGGTNRFWGKVLEGWENNIIFQWQAGRPWEVSGNVIQVRDARNPNIDWSAHKVFAVRTSTSGNNTAACVATMSDTGVIALQPHSVAAGCTDYDFLRVPRYSPGNVATGRAAPRRDGRIRLNARPSIDFSLNKNTRISERVSVQFRFEAFNFTNTYEYGGRQFNTDPESVNFGSLFPSEAGNTETRYPRQIQLAFKILF